jgi:hypothetical protein
LLQDLSGGNVLLTSSTANPHGFTARVTDFGLARNLDVKARTAPGRYGTITHMCVSTATGWWSSFWLTHTYQITGPVGIVHNFAMAHQQAPGL